MIDDSQKALAEGFYKLSGGFIEQSNELKSYISLKELNEYFVNAIASNPKEKIKKYLNINYELIEGPNKKSTCKFCEANLIVSFRAASKELFRIDTDVILVNKTELESRINCLVKVYKNHGK